MTDPLDAREVLALVARMSPPELAMWRELGGDLTREQRRRVREWRRGECVRIGKELETRKAVNMDELIVDLPVVKQRLGYGGSYGPCVEGDLLIIGVGGHLVIGIVNSSCPTTIVFGDTIMRVPRLHGLRIPKADLSPEAGRFIGRSFASLDEIRSALAPFRLMPAAKGKVTA